MLLRIMQALVLGLMVVIACNDKSEDEGGSGTQNRGYQLNASSDAALLSDGKGTINVQLTKDGKAVTDAEGTEVVLTVVCGDNDKQFSKQLGKDGKASIAVDLSEEGWTVSDWGTCKLSAVVKIDDKDIEIKDVDLQTVSGEGATSGACEKVGGCDDDQLPSYGIGEEIGQQSLAGGGTLQLHGCSDASLYTVSGDNVTRDADGVVAAAAETMNIPVMFVLGSAGSNCKLQHTLAGKTTDWATIADTAAGDNLAAGLAVVPMRKVENNRSTFSISLPSKPQEYVAAPTVYTSSDAGATAAKVKVTSTTWNSTLDTEVAWNTDEPQKNNKVLLRVTMATSDTPPASDTASKSNDTAWWHMYPDVHIGAVKVGREFTVSRVTGTVKLKVAESCGLHFFYLGSDHAPQGRIPTDGTAVDITASGSFEMLAIDGGTASYKANCNIAVDVNNLRVRASSTEIDSARPAITGIQLDDKNNQGTVYFVVELPTWDANHGTVISTGVHVSNNGGTSWEALTSNPQWGKKNEHIFAWNATATQNQALVSVDITPTGQSNAHTWWYYAEAK